MPLPFFKTMEPRGGRLAERAGLKDNVANIGDKNLTIFGAMLLEKFLAGKVAQVSQNAIALEQPPPEPPGRKSSLPPIA